MSGGWTGRLAGMDPSVLGVLATLVANGDAEGGLPLAEVVRGYRALLMEARYGGGTWHEAAGFRDSMLEQVQGSLLPALVRGGWIKDAGDQGWDRVVPVGSWFPEAIRDRDGSVRMMLDLAFPVSGSAPAPVPEAAVPGGSRLVCEGLNKAFKRRRVVRDVSLQLEQGEVVGLLGPNGAGKTTTFYLILA